MSNARAITFSPSLTIPLTHDCPWHCAYCGYRSDRSGLIAPAEFDRLLALARERRVTEVLFLSGEVPDTLPHLREELDQRGHASFIAFTRWACEIVLEAGMLPHTNIGALSQAQFETLAPVNASMGLMLENIDDAFNRTVAPQKSAAGRLRAIEAAGRARVPFTSGILVGLGESHASRLLSLDALAEVHARHGHLQEIILQNYVPNARSSLRPAPPAAGLDDLIHLIQHWRAVAPGVPIQVPPNIQAHWEELLPLVDDLGGISAEGDLVNFEHRWEPPARYAAACARRGLQLRHRWAVYDEFIRRGWVSQRVRDVIQRHESEADVAHAGPGRRRASDPLTRAARGGGLSVGEAVALAEAGGEACEEAAMAADELNRSLHGDVVTFVVNRNANFTNVCTTNCSFCGFYRPPGHPEAYTRSIQAVVERVMQTPWVTEVCIQGGIHPDLGLDYYVGLVRALREALPGVHVHGYSPMEIHALHEKSGKPYAAILAELRDAGLGSIPGTAAEILDDAVRGRISPGKLRADAWVEIVRTAHEAGLRSTATVMFGHEETWPQVFGHMERLRRLQRQTGGFTEFIPLAFIPHRNRLGSELARARGVSTQELAVEGADKVRRLYPLARLFLGMDLPNLQTSWVKLGVTEAARMLGRGCNDFGGTLYEESITRGSGGEHGECLTPAEIRRAIESAGKVPRQRNTLYGPAVASPHEAAATKRSTFTGSLMPGLASTPLETSSA